MGVACLQAGQGRHWMDAGQLVHLDEAVARSQLESARSQVNSAGAKARGGWLGVGKAGDGTGLGW